jgi:hypothetical protein
MNKLQWIVLIGGVIFLVFYYGSIQESNSKLCEDYFHVSCRSYDPDERICDCEDGSHYLDENMLNEGVSQFYVDY